MLPKYFIMVIMTMIIILFLSLLSKKAAGQYQLPRLWDPLKLSKSDSLTNEIPVEKDTAIYNDVALGPYMCIFPTEASYRGGYKRWKRYLCKNLHYPQSAVDSNIQGTVMVQFVVEKDGRVTEAKSISGPYILRIEAERVIRKSGKWKPAVLNKKKIKSYKKQPLIFRFADCDDRISCCEIFHQN